MISILAQVFVHLLCFMPLYFEERHWLGLLLPILIHYALTAIIKIVLDPSLYLAKNNKKTIAIVNVIGSVIININIKI